MQQKIAASLLLCLLLGPVLTYCQSADEEPGGVVHLPGRMLHRIQEKTASLDLQLTRQTEKYLERMARREQRLYKKLYRVDSVAAKSLFAGTQGQYAAL